ncbi:MAG: hypothetical protein KAI22_01535 [Gammaproteobacteria bacterium]|nr:hypothetical protein [Gammaproteobacteria bacterium]
MKNYGFIFYIGLFTLLQTSLLTANETLAATDNPLLKYVPAETVFFSGNTQLIRMDDYPFFSFKPSVDIPMSQSERKALGKELSFLYELYLDLAATVVQGNAVIRTHYGLPQNIAVVLYGIGISPVLKITLADEQAFLNVINQAEKKSGFQHQPGNLGSVKYRAYPMGDKHQLIISIQSADAGQKTATIALLSNTVGESQKQLVFGLTQPEQSIKTKVKTIQQENQYLPLLVSFLDFKELVRSLFKVKSKTNSKVKSKTTSKTQPAENPWVELFADQDQFFAQLQASDCETDVMKLAQDMPLFIAGYKKYQVQEQRIIMNLEALLEIKNQNVKTELKRFRGFIPDHVRHGVQDNILAFGLGVNLSQISPFFVYVSKAFRETTFQCQQLKEIQKNIAEFNPLMLAMVTGIVDGVQGISFALQDFRASNTEQTPQGQSSNKKSSYAETAKKFELSALISLSADNPLKVWQMMAAFVPQAAQLTPAEKPQKLKLPELDAIGLEIFIAIKGQHLVLYTGKQAEVVSNNLINEKMITNGFFQETVNYTELTRAMKELRQVIASHLASQQGNQQTLPAEACIYFDETIAVLSRFSGFIDYQNDFVSKGWLNVLNADIEFKPILTTAYQLAGKYQTYSMQDGCQLLKDGLEEVLEDGTGFYQQYSDDGQCFIFETRYRWTHRGAQLDLQYVSEHRRPEGICSNEFEAWTVPEAEYINDSCQLRTEPEGDFACLYQWDGVLNKAVYKRL